METEDIVTISLVVIRFSFSSSVTKPGDLKSSASVKYS